MPRFSVIIPVYNLADKASRIITQIIQQPYKDLEVIVVDDGSTDNTLHILQDLANRHQCLRLFSQKNAGPSAARNYGLKKARGTYVLFCDGDDEVCSEQMASLLAAHQEACEDLFVFGWTIVQKRHEQTISRRILLQQPQKIYGHNDIIMKSLVTLGADGRLYNLWNKLYRLDIIRRNNINIREDLRFGEDLLFNLSYLSVAHSVVFSDFKPYYVYEEDSPTSIVSTSKLQYNYRTANSKGLQLFASQCPSLQTAAAHDLTRFIQWRWLVSYTLAICQSNKKLFEKYSLVHRAIITERLQPLHLTKHLSRKKIIMEYILFALTKIPGALFFIMSIALRFKKWRRSRPYIVITLPKI